jgi:hypothetical protein
MSVLNLTKPQIMIHYIYEGNQAFSIGGHYMSTISPNFIAVTPDRSQVIPCHNLSSARAYAEGRAPVGPTENNEFSYLAQAFVSPSGQYYVEIWHGPRVLRMDVANAQTARYYAKNGVSPSLAKSIYLSTLK